MHAELSPSRRPPMRNPRPWSPFTKMGW